MATKLHCREYTADDWPMVEQWVEDHGHGRINGAALSPIGLICEEDGEPVCAMWCLLSLGIGVAILQHCVTKPAIGLQRASLALGYTLGCVENVAKKHDYGLMLGYVEPAIARYMERRHDYSSDKQVIQVAKILWQSLPSSQQQ